MDRRSALMRDRPDFSACIKNAGWNGPSHIVWVKCATGLNRPKRPVLPSLFLEVSTQFERFFFISKNIFRNIKFEKYRKIHFEKYF